MFDRILAALDEPGDGEAVLPHLRTLAQAESSRVMVMKMVPFLETLLEMPHELAPEAEGDDEGAAGYVSAVVEALQAEGIPAEGFTNVGRSGLSVAAAANRVDASLIVMTASRIQERVGSVRH